MERIRIALGLGGPPPTPDGEPDEEELRAENENVREAMEHTLIDWKRDIGSLTAKVMVVERPSWDRLYGPRR